MFCPNCNQYIPDNSNFCNLCGSNLSGQPSAGKKLKFFKGPTDGGKSFAAIMTALMIFPATLSIALDMIIHIHDGWSTYVVATLITAWVIIVFPVLRITPAPVTALICLFSLFAYIAFIIGRKVEGAWFNEIILPLYAMAAIFISADSALIGAGKVKGLHFMSLLSVEAAIFFIVSEMIIDNFKFGEITLGWSAIIGCFCISAVALYEAINYSVNIAKKRRKK